MRHTLSTGLAFLAGFCLLALLLLTRAYSFLLFHTLAECFSVVVAGAIFLVGWNTRRLVDNHTMLCLATGFLFVGCFDLMHALAYSGMDVLPNLPQGVELAGRGRGANLAAQLWIAARLLQAVTMILAPSFSRRAFPIGPGFLGFAAAAGALALTIATGYFPDCFVLGVGLTPFKKVAEAGVVLLLCGAAVNMGIHRSAFGKRAYRDLQAAIVLSALSELAFTLYLDVFDLPNMVGHLLKVLAFYCIYRALVAATLNDPLGALFGRLAAAEETYRSLVDNSPTGIFRCGPDGMLREANPAMAAMFGYDDPKVLIASRRIPMPPLDAAWSGFRQVEGELLRNDGSRFTALMKIRPVRDAAGILIYLDGQVEDITERRRREVEDSRNLQRLERLVQLSRGMLEESTMDGLLPRVAQAAMQLSGSDCAAAMMRMGGSEFCAGAGRLQRDAALALCRSDGLAKALEGSLSLRLTATELGSRPDLAELRDLLTKSGCEPGRGLLAARFDDAAGRAVGLVLASDCRGEEQDAADEAALRQLAYVASLRRGQIRAWADAEQRARQSEEGRSVLEAVMEHAPFGLMVCDAAGQLQLMSRAGRALFGLPDDVGALPFDAAAAAGAGRYQFCDANGRELLPEELPLTLALGHGLIQGGEYLVRFADGRQLPLWLNAGPVLDAEGAIRGAVCSFQDISELKLAAEQDRRRTQELRALVENAPDAIVRYGPDLAVRLANPAARQLLLHRRDTLHHGAFAPVQEQILRVFATGRERSMQIELPSPNGQRWFMIRLAPEFGPQGVENVLAICRDVSGLKRLEAELTQAKERAESANRSKGEFLANMSHEIRTPIGAVLGLGKLLLQQDLSPTQREYVEMMLDSGRALLNIINDVLDISKIEAGRLHIVAEDFDLASALERLARPFALQAQSKGLSFLMDLAPGLPARVNGDPNRLGQILRNFLSNAIKFTEAGGISLVATPVDASERGDPSGDGHPVIRFTVQDTGIGIPEDKLDGLFTSFTQLEAGLSKRYAGTGLGLAISKALAEQMGGSVRVSSRLGHGSSFEVLLPLVPASRAVSKDVEAKPIRPGGARAPVQPEPQPTAADRATALLGPLRILLAEDNHINQLFMSEMLRGDGHEVHLAGTGVEALEALARERFDVVLMDVQMPELDGLSAVARLRAGQVAGADAHVPVVALTAYATPDDGARCRAAGMDAHVPKPVEWEYLYQTLLHLLSRNQGAIP